MGKILVIDDSNIIRLKIIRILESNGFTNNVGIGTADLIIEKPYVYLTNVILIIMDIRLPGFSGIEASYWLKSQKEYADIPIIFLTGVSDSDTVKKALLAGAVDYIVKPFGEIDLINRVQNIIGRSEKDSVADIPFISKDEVRKIISMEYDRSIRGKQPVSLLLLSTGSNGSGKLIKKVAGTLRQIDRIFAISNKEILVILPLTDENGAKIVAEKIERELNIEKDLFLKIKYFSVEIEQPQPLTVLLGQLFSVAPPD